MSAGFRADRPTERSSAVRNVRGLASGGAAREHESLTAVRAASDSGDSVRRMKTPDKYHEEPRLSATTGNSVSAVHSEQHKSSRSNIQGRRWSVGRFADPSGLDVEPLLVGFTHRECLSGQGAFAHDHAQ